MTTGTAPDSAGSGASRRRPPEVLERLVYQSTARHEFGSLHLFSLLTMARLRNSALSITGHLLYHDGRFVQCLEGSPKHVEQVWQRVLRDDRHHEIQLLVRGPAQERRFSQWAMACSSDEALHVHGTVGFFRVNTHGISSLGPHCSAD